MCVCQPKLLVLSASPKDICKAAKRFLWNLVSPIQGHCSTASEEQEKLDQVKRFTWLSNTEFSAMQEGRQNTPGSPKKAKYPPMLLVSRGHLSICKCHACPQTSREETLAGGKLNVFPSLTHLRGRSGLDGEVSPSDLQGLLHGLYRSL